MILWYMYTFSAKIAQKLYLKIKKDKKVNLVQVSNLIV